VSLSDCSFQPLHHLRQPIGASSDGGVGGGAHSGGAGGAVGAAAFHRIDGAGLGGPAAALDGTHVRGKIGPQQQPQGVDFGHALDRMGAPLYTPGELSTALSTY
jgi:hypothetical protein